MGCLCLDTRLDHSAAAEMGQGGATNGAHDFRCTRPDRRGLTRTACHLAALVLALSYANLFKMSHSAQATLASAACGVITLHMSLQAMALLGLSLFRLWSLATPRAAFVVILIPLGALALPCRVWMVFCLGTRAACHACQGQRAHMAHADWWQMGLRHCSPSAHCGCWACCLCCCIEKSRRLCFR